MREQAIKLTRSSFAQEKCGLRLWNKPEAIYALADMGVNRFLIRSANGIGKSSLLASLIINEVTQNDDVSVLCTGANATSLKETLWRSVKRQAKFGHFNLDGFNKNSWEYSPTQRVVAISPKAIESAQGYHAERVAIVADEATAMDAEKFTALMSNATGTSSIVVVTYNPINTDAVVYELEQSARDFTVLLNENGKIDTEKVNETISAGFWVSIGISGFEHPNVIAGEEIIKGAITRSYIESMCRIESAECSIHEPGAVVLPWSQKAYFPTPELLARALGRWSEAVAIGFISGGVVVNSWSVERQTGLRIAGADIGGGGEDPSVWTHFRGNEQFPFEQLKTGELGVVASQLDKYCNEHEIDAVAIDDTGVGHGVTDRLQEMKPKYQILPVQFGSAPKNFPEVSLRQPANARCEMYLLLEKAMRSSSIRITYDKELQRELCSQKIIGMAKGEKIRLEDKSLIKKRLGRSPNKADATALAHYGGRLLQYHNRPRIY